MWGVLGAWGIAVIVMLLFWGGGIVGIVLGIRWLMGQAREPEQDAAMDILRHRYARGDISKEEFEAKKRDLSQ